MTQFIETFLNKDNRTPGYERFYYSKRYMQFKSEQFRTPEDYKRIGLALEYNIEKSNFLQKLRRRRKRLDAMDYDIPYEYLDEIGANRDELETCIEADMELFQQERSKPRYPEKAIVRYVAAFFGAFRFPEGTTEEAAIQMLLEGDVARFSKIISYTQLLMILLSPGADATPSYVWYPPEVENRHNRIHIDKLPEGLGVTRLR